MPMLVFTKLPHVTLYSINKPLFYWADNILFYLLWILITFKKCIKSSFSLYYPYSMLLLFLAIFTCMLFQKHFRSIWSSLLKFYGDVAEFKDRETDILKYWVFLPRNKTFSSIYGYLLITLSWKQVLILRFCWEPPVLLDYLLCFS